jgi:hypothetical protein
MVAQSQPIQNLVEARGLTKNYAGGTPGSAQSLAHVGAMVETPSFLALPVWARQPAVAGPLLPYPSPASLSFGKLDVSCR